MLYLYNVSSNINNTMKCSSQVPVLGYGVHGQSLESYTRLRIAHKSK